MGWVDGSHQSDWAAEFPRAKPFIERFDDIHLLHNNERLYWIRVKYYGLGVSAIYLIPR